MSAEGRELPLTVSPRWWLSLGEGTATGPFWKREIDTTWKRYRLIRKNNLTISRRNAWRLAAEQGFTRG